MKSTVYSLPARRASLSDAGGQSTVGGLRSLVDRPRSTVHGLWSASAFTLIEVLVAMTVLAVMILMVANIFQSSSASWNIGTQKADMNTAARAALDFMARELASAVAGTIETAGSAPLAPLRFQLNSGNELLFVSLAGDVENGRALRGAAFYHNNNQLMYARHNASFNPYTTLPDATNGAEVLITNVFDLQISAFANAFGLTNNSFTKNFDSSAPANFDQLPICVDIALIMLSNDDMHRYNQLSAPADKTAFSARNAKLYSTRIYFLNR